MSHVADFTRAVVGQAVGLRLLRRQVVGYVAGSSL